MQSTSLSRRCRFLVWLALANLLACRLLMAQATRPAPAADAAASEPSEPPKVPARQPAQEATEAAWPPGLIMEGFDKVGLGDPMKKPGLRFYGFVETGFTGRLTGDSDPLAGRAFDARRPNNLRLNQTVLTLERPYDATQSFDAGFRMDGMYGGDALLTHSAGLFTKAGHGQGDNWADVPQIYGQLWFKTGRASGLELMVGKFLTPMGFEGTYAPGNSLYSHSFLYSFAEPISHTGVKANYVFNSQASAFFAIVNGWDDFADNNHAHSYMTGLSLSGKEQIDNHARNQMSVSMMTGPEQSNTVHDYRTLLSMTGTHWWTAKLSSGLAADWGTEKNVGGFDRANWYGVAHYLSYIIDPHVTATWRAEWFDDDSGRRIGTEGSYLENTLGLAIAPCPKDHFLRNVMIRPEIRWDNAQHPAFDDRFNQLTAAVDVIVKF
jgi:hypothetical protein